MFVGAFGTTLREDNTERVEAAFCGAPGGRIPLGPVEEPSVAEL